MVQSLPISRQKSILKKVFLNQNSLYVRATEERKKSDETSSTPWESCWGRFRSPSGIVDKWRVGKEVSRRSTLKTAKGECLLQSIDR